MKKEKYTFTKDEVSSLHKYSDYDVDDLYDIFNNERKSSRVSIGSQSFKKLRAENGTDIVDVGGEDMYHVEGGLLTEVQYKDWKRRKIISKL